MKSFLVICLIATLLLVQQSYAADAKDEAVATHDGTANGIRIFRRLIPADVLRDFPGMCFASTRCATVLPNKKWDLKPFCGQSTCVSSDDDAEPRLLELVEDCGPLPKPNPKCKLDTEKTNKSADFPLCCPVFTCEDGAVLEYPAGNATETSPATEKAKN